MSAKRMFPNQRESMADAGRLHELERKFNENPRRYFAPLANEYRKAGEVDRAIELCRTYLPQQPSHMSGYIVYGQSLHDAGLVDEATAVFNQALGLDPENIIALRHLGDIAKDQGDRDAAIKWYERVLELDPRNEEITAFVAALSAAPQQRPKGPERPAPPTIRPEPEFDPSAVALSDIVSQPDDTPSTPIGGPAHNAGQTTRGTQPTPTGSWLERVERVEPVDRSAQSERNDQPESQQPGEDESLISETTVEESFEVVTWPHVSGTGHVDVALSQLDMHSDAEEAAADQGDGEAAFAATGSTAGARQG